MNLGPVDAGKALHHSSRRGCASDGKAAGRKFTLAGNIDATDRSTLARRSEAEYDCWAGRQLSSKLRLSQPHFRFDELRPG